MNFPFTGTFRNKLPSLFLSRFMAKIEENEKGCWIWTGAKFVSGYGKINTGGKMVRAHRISYELSNGKIPIGMHVLHTCDNKLCVNPNHLEVGTQKKNMIDASTRGLIKRSLTEDQAISLLNDPENKKRGFIVKKSSELGVSINTVLRLLKGKTWKYLHTHPKDARAKGWLA
jgi:hypothetical protein